MLPILAGLVVLLALFLAYRTRRQLAASEARYRGLFERAADGIAILDADGIVREANPRLAELLALPLDQVVGHRLRDFYAATQGSSSSGGSDAGVMNDHLAALAGTLRLATRTLVRGDGRQVDVEIAFARADRPAAGAIGAIVQAMVRDVTQRRARERHRLEEQRLDAIARFAGGIAHQFNNLLSGILTHVSVLRQDTTQAPAAAELDEVAAAARRGRDLTDELLRFTRSDPLQLRPTDPAQALESVGRLARGVLAEGGGGAANIDVHVPPGLPPIAADIDQLVHACTQVVLNARDAMRGRPNPRLTLAGAEDGSGRVRITITDNGRGMDAATVERAFEPFFTTKPMHQAKGLGLATVQRVMRDHGGSVRVESEIGRGTSVHLLFLVSREPLPAAPPAPPAPTPPVREATAAGATILIVDDEPIVRSSLKRALGRFGYRVLEAGDGGAAVAAMTGAQPPVDLVILDLVLPGGGAGIFELLKAVRPDVKVLISSGYSPDADAARGLAARVEGFLPKPYELTQLRDAVTQALSGRAA
ncbi:MAG TPA: ATP-binding protein [Gemmatimonadales bacterium]|jgi:PAS domain S-box-containing protein|nr:ATP-binding protein [Gemmatimonadales bacterium]